jgi:hypothetical protein
MVSYLRRGRNRSDGVRRKAYRLLVFSIIATLGVLFFAIVVLKESKQRESNTKFAGAMQAFVKDTQRYVQEGSSGSLLPTAKLTGDPTNDEIVRCINELVQTVRPILAETNKKLNALETDDNAFKSSFTADQLKTKCQTEANKRIQSRAVVAKGRADVPQRELRKLNKVRPWPKPSPHD